MSLKTVSTQQKYGLIKKVGVPKKSTTAPLRKPLGFSNGFDECSEDEDDSKVNQKDVTRVNSLIGQRSEQAEKEANRLYNEALSQDQSAFDYDGVYDSIKATEEVKVHALSQSKKDEAPKARYINNLMTTASVRVKEKDRVYEKKLLKERKLEDEEYGDKPKFMTTAYKNKLMDSQKWEMEDKLTDELEKKHDVRTLGMDEYYSNLLTKNVAMGADVASSALGAYTAGSKRQSQMSSSSVPIETSQEDTDTTGNDDGSEIVSLTGKRTWETAHETEKRMKEETLAAVDDESTFSSKADQTVRKDSRMNIDDSMVKILDDQEVPVIESIIVPTKDEVVSSARQRFLDRKLASAAVS